MFSEFEKPEYNIPSAIESQDSETILDIWRQSTELQEEIIRNLMMIRDDEPAQAIFQGLKERFPQSSEYEKKNILAAFEYLGDNNLPAELATTDFLVDISQKDFPFLDESIGSLKGKVFRNTLDRNTKLGNEGIVDPKIVPVLRKSGAKFLDIIEGDFDKGLKLKALTSIWRCKGLGLDERIIPDLKALVESEDSELGFMALTELFAIMDPHEEFLIEALDKEIQQLDLEAIDMKKLQSLTVCAMHTEDVRFTPFIESASKRIKGETEK